MRTLLQEKRKQAVSEWIFPHYANPSEPLHPDTAYRKLKDLLSKAKLPSIRFHDLRHTFATMALENGMDVKTLSDMISHVSAETTLNIYSHITDILSKTMHRLHPSYYSLLIIWIPTKHSYLHNTYNKPKASV